MSASKSNPSRTPEVAIRTGLRSAWRGPDDALPRPHVVLVVDDHAAKRYLMVRALSGKGWLVEEAETGEEALARVAREPQPSLMVLDVQLPGLNGFQVVERLKADPETATLPVVQVSSVFTERAFAVQGLDLGASAYLSSPDPEVLLATVRTLLREREAELERARLLAETEAILESLPDGVYVGNEAGITRANAVAARMLGLDGPDDLAKPLPVLAELLAPRAAATGEPLAPEELPFAVALGGVAAVRELVLRQPRSGRDIVVRAAAAPVRLGPRVIGAVTVHADISETKRLEAELKATAEFRERLLGIVSHDLRSPVQAVSLAAEVLTRHEPLGDRGRRLVARIGTSAARMGRMISDLLDLTRSRLGGGIPVRPEATDLATVCREVVDEIALSQPGRTVRVAVDGDSKGEWDPGRMAQVLVNLVGNALRYSPDDTPVSVVVSGSDQGVSVRVHNFGPPIPTEVLPSLFEPFRRGQDGQPVASPSGGLGLGLHIAQEIVFAHRGRIEVTSSREGGTTFVVSVPRRAAARA